MQNATEAEDMLNRVMTKDNIGITALLELKEGYLNYGNDVNMPRQQVLVSNVHIHWDPEFKDVKLIQSVMLMHELMTIMQEINPGFMVQGGRLNIFCLVKISLNDYYEPNKNKGRDAARMNNETWSKVAWCVWGCSHRVFLHPGVVMGVAYF